MKKNSTFKLQLQMTFNTCIYPATKTAYMSVLFLKVIHTFFHKVPASDQRPCWHKLKVTTHAQIRATSIQISWNINFGCALSSHSSGSTVLSPLTGTLPLFSHSGKEKAQNQTAPNTEAYHFCLFRPRFLPTYVSHV